MKGLFFIKKHVIIFLLVLIFGIILVRTAWVCDDAYITFRVVDNFIKGYGLRWNIDERVQVYTHTLWMFLVSSLYLLTGDLYFAVIIFSILISLIAIILLLNRIAIDNKARIWGLLFFISSKAFVDYSTSGLENPLTHLLASIFLVTFWLNDFTRKNIFYLSLLAGLSAFNRLDIALIYVPSLFYAWTKILKKKLIWPILGGFVPLLVWEMFALIYYGFPFPNAAYSKLFAVGISQIDFIKQGIYYLINSLRMDPLTLSIILLSLIAGFFKRDGRFRALLAGVALYLIYVVRIGGDFMSGRFLAAPFFFSVAILMTIKIKGKLIWLPFLLAIALLNIINPYAPIKSGKDYQNLEFDKHGIADERGYYFQDTGLIKKNRQFTRPVLNKKFADEAQRTGGIYIFNAIGFLAFFVDQKFMCLTNTESAILF